MRLFSYIVTHDTGFAPNPFWNYCTLSCCKPNIRKSAEIGDWIIGLSPKKYNNKIIYVMKITENPIAFKEYFFDDRFKQKIPNMKSEKCIDRRGDNIYKPNESDFIQLHSRHSNKNGTENIKNKNKDLKGKFVLISNCFYYFGNNMIDLPENLNFLIVGRGHKCNFNESQKIEVISFIEKHNQGINGRPIKWRENDDSWDNKYL